MTETSSRKPVVSDVESLVTSRDPTMIAQMFNSIASRYDRMNRVMTFGQDVRWRRLAADAAALRPGASVLDVATGTGDMARELAGRVGSNGQVVGIDIAEGMMDLGRAKCAGLPVQFEVRDVHSLGFDSEFDAAVVAFGFRNFTDRPRGIESMSAALKPGGRLVVLELIPPHNRLRPVIKIYESRIIPLIARVFAEDGDAYRYLPESVAASSSVVNIKDMLKAAGLRNIASRELNLGTVGIVWGTR